MTEVKEGQAPSSNKTGFVFSKLIAIELKNVMSIEYARIPFTDAVINLVGYNDSGKSAVTRALEIIFYDEYSKDQAGFIKDGEDHFAIGLEFSDGISINKYKYSNGQSEWEMLKGDEVIYTNRLEKGLAAMSTIPQVIAQYLNVMEDAETGEKLNIRRNTDKLFLVGMSGGEVYKIINAILNLDVLVATVARLNEDRNDMQTKLVAESTSLVTLRNELDALIGVTGSALSELADKSEKLRDSKHRIESIIALDGASREFKSIKVHTELNLVDYSRLAEIVGIAEAKRVMDNSIKTTQPELTLVDTERLVLLNGIADERKKLDTPIPPELPTLDSTRMNEITEIGKAYNALYAIRQELGTINTQFKAVTDELGVLAKEHNFKVCKNCGTIAV